MVERVARFGREIVSRATASAGRSSFELPAGELLGTGRSATPARRARRPRRPTGPPRSGSPPTFPASSASTGISIFIDSRMTTVSPSSTSSPTATSIFQTVPVMWASMSAMARHNSPPCRRKRGPNRRIACPHDPRDRPGDDGDDLPRLRRGRGPARPRLQRVRPAFPPPGLGRARRERDLGGDAAGRVAALADAGVEGSDLAGIGITNQRETVVAWDPETGEPIHNALVWQDRRTARRCDELRETPAVHDLSASAPASSSTPTSPAPRSSG